MTRCQLPPVRIDSEPMNASVLAQQIDWGLRERLMPQIWKRSAGQGVLVVILDTGVPQHEDLPMPVYTYNFTNSPTEFDRNSHHTHCAGIVAASNNDAGVVGWAHESALAHIKVLGDSGSGTMSSIERGVDRAVREWKTRKADYTGCIISMSIGGGYDTNLERAMVDAADAGILLVAAAGNSGFRGGRSTVDYPGTSTSTIGVAAYRRDGNIATFSSGGPEVDIAMPGEGILSTVLGNRYQVMSGTSMATPAAAGLLACVLSSRPHDAAIRTPVGVKDFLRQHVDDRGELGKDNRFGFGVPDANELVRDPVYWMF